ncbi:MAG: DUF1385 domain-containing protein [Bacillota bacterium]|nr:MAG: DUF1385 domain-containing protein [Bacillota bacterium]
MDMKNLFGGQAVIEGVMMRGAGRMAIAVRRADGTIALQVSAYRPWTEKSPWLGLPVVRGAVALADALVTGIRALNYSARVVEEDGAAGTGTATGGDRTGAGEDRWLALVNALAVALALVVFVLLPTWLAAWLPVAGDLGRNIVEGGVRLLLLLGYLLAIGRIPDIRRVYQYHGAEHKAIHALEAGAPLTPAGARPFPRFHPRCGTAFLLFVAVLAVAVHALFGWPSFWWRTAVRLALVPVIAGLAFEWIRLAGRSRSRWAAVLAAPGLWLQRLTTEEPGDDQLEVALVALRACLGEAAGGGLAAAQQVSGAAGAAAMAATAAAAPVGVDGGGVRSGA